MASQPDCNHTLSLASPGQQRGTPKLSMLKPLDAGEGS